MFYFFVYIKLYEILLLLKNFLVDLATKKDDFGEDNLVKSPGYDCKTYPKEINALKKKFGEFIPVGKNEKSSWIAACSWIAQSQSKKRKSLGLSERNRY